MMTLLNFKTNFQQQMVTNGANTNLYQSVMTGHDRPQKSQQEQRGVISGLKTMISLSSVIVQAFIFVWLPNRECKKVHAPKSSKNEEKYEMYKSVVCVPIRPVFGIHNQCAVVKVHVSLSSPINIVRVRWSRLIREHQSHQ